MHLAQLLNLRDSGGRLTRGSGLLETWLAKLRFWKARQLFGRVDARGRLLDVGCGSFPYSLMNLPFSELHGIDLSLSDELIEELGRAGLVLTNVDFTQGLPYDDDTFDAVTMLASIEHIDYPQETVKEVGRVLRPGGYFVLTTPSSWTEPIFTLLARVGLLSREELDEHRDLLSPQELREMVLEAGFPLEHFEIGTFEFGLNQWVRARR